MNIDALIGDYLRSSTNGDARDEIVLEITQSIELKKKSLLEVVSALGDYLTETDATIRSKSMHLLQEVLSSIPVDLLSGQHVTVMTQFFCDRLSDDVCLSESLAALLSISKLSRFAEEDAQKVAHSIFAISGDAQQHPQRTRFRIYTLFESIMARKRKALRAMQGDFVKGFMNLMSGEKDPRNLMLAFSIMRIILEEFDIVSYAADLFDIVYCYFPITFRPPPDDPTSITTDDLKSRLRECLCATHQFAPYLIPALIEKLNAVAVSVKKDTLLTLTGCCQGYSARVLDTYTSQLWAALKFEIIQSEDGILEEVALSSLSAITECLSRGLAEMPKQGSLSRWLQPIVLEAVEQLKEPELKSAKPCGKILKSVATVSPVCLEVVSRSVLPGLLAICDEVKSTNQKASLLDVLCNLIEATISVESSRSVADSSSVVSALEFVKTEIFDQLSKCLIGVGTNEVELRKAALSAFAKLVRVQKLLVDKEFRIIISYLNDLVVEEEGEVSDEALLVLAQLSRSKSALILECTFPVLLAKLPGDEDACDLKVVRPMLNALGILSEEKVMFETLIIRLLSRLDSSLTANSKQETYPVLLLTTILQVLRKHSAIQHKDVALFFNKLVPQIFQRTVNQLGSALTSSSALEVTSEIVNICTRSSDVEAQRLIAADLFSLYITGGINGLVTHTSDTFRPFDTEKTDKDQLNTIALFVGVYAGLSTEIEVVNMLNLELFITSVNLIPKCSNEIQRLSLLRLMGLMINKTKSDADVTATIAHSVTIPSFTSPKNLDVLLWISKGLVLRNHKSARILVDLLLDMLPHTEIGADVGRGFQVIIGDDPFFCKSNQCNIKILHKQKFYGSVVPELLARAEKTSSELKPNYFRALSAIIANVPQTVFVSDMAKLMPMLLQCMELPDVEMRRAAIQTVDSVGSDAKDVIALHLSSLVPALLASTTVSQENNLRVRVASLRLLASLVDILRADKLQPFKAKIIRALALVLDDPKRAVRREAVTTRHRYFQGI